jgi:hypothetical protein
MDPPATLKLLQLTKHKTAPYPIPPLFTPARWTMGRKTTTEQQATTWHLQSCNNHNNQGKVRTRTATTTTTIPPTTITSNCSWVGTGSRKARDDGEK